MSRAADITVVQDLKRFLGDRYVNGGSNEVEKNLVLLRMLQASGTLPESLQFEKNEVSNSSYKLTVSRLGFGKSWDIYKVGDVQIANIGIGKGNEKVGTYFEDNFGDVPTPPSQAQPQNPTASDELRFLNPTGSSTAKAAATSAASRVSSVAEGSTSAGSDRTLTGGLSSGGPSGGDGLTPTSGGGGGGGVATPSPKTGIDSEFAITNQNFNGVPPDGEVWKIGSDLFLAYRSDVAGPYVYYKIATADDAARIFPDGVPAPKTLTQQEVNSRGWVPMGSHNLLTGDLLSNWEEGFNDTLEREVMTSPWLTDGEVVAVTLGAWLEGRAPTKAELEGTAYFSSRTEGEVAYIVDTAGMGTDELMRYHDRNRLTVREMLLTAGVRSPNETVVNFMADKWTSGQWDDSWTARQVIALANPQHSKIKMDDELTDLTKDMEFDTLGSKTEEVRATVEKWLGPSHGGGYSASWLEDWAGTIQDDPNAENDLREFLQGQRLALYPEYSNPNLTYEDISGTWKNVMFNEWGVDAQNSQQYGTLDRVIRANNVEEGSRILRQEGLNQGIGQVEDKMRTEAINIFGGPVVESA